MPYVDLIAQVRPDIINVVPSCSINNIFEPQARQKQPVRSAKNQISMGIRPVSSSMCACALYVDKDPYLLQADSEDSDLTGLMPRLI